MTNALEIRMKLLAALIALVAWLGVALQLWLSFRLTRAMGMTTLQGLAIYLGYFTVLTNILVGIAVTWPLALPSSAWGRFFARPFAMGGVTVSIAFVGAAYFALLRHIWNPQGWQLVADVLMHYVVPSLMLIYSVMALRHARLSWTAPLGWSLYPMVYFVYVLVRGTLMGRYPYGFIDVSQLGYAITLRNAVFLLIAFLLLAYALMLIWRVDPRRLTPPGRTPP